MFYISEFLQHVFLYMLFPKLYWLCIPLEICGLLVQFCLNLTLGDILLGLIFLSGSIVATFVFSNEICNFALHYVDGMFLGSSLLVLSVMMVYKYWDSITKDDLEFAIGGAPQIWHLKSDKENKLY